MYRLPSFILHRSVCIYGGPFHFLLLSCSLSLFLSVSPSVLPSHSPSSITLNEGYGNQGWLWKSHTPTCSNKYQILCYFVTSVLYFSSNLNHPDTATHSVWSLGADACVGDLLGAKQLRQGVRNLGQRHLKDSC